MFIVVFGNGLWMKLN